MVASMDARKNDRVFALKIAGFFLVIGFLIYGHSVYSNRFVTLDDNYLIYENEQVLRPSLQSFHHIFTTYDPELYVPFTFLSLQLDYMIGGLHPTMYHLTNLLLHIANAIGVALLALALMQRRSIAWLAGLLFLLHPVQVEAVAWAAARKDLLSTFFLVAALLTYVRYVRFHSTRMIVATTFLSIAAILSKPTAIVLPLLLLLIDWYLGHRYEKRLVYEKVPIIGLALGLGIIAIQGKSGGWTGLGALQVFLMMCKSMAFSLAHVVWPVHLSVFYLQPPELIAFSSLSLVLSAVFVAWLGISFFVFARTYRTLLFSGLFFFFTFMPSLLSFYHNEYYLTSDRYLYVPMIALCLMAAVAMIRMIEHQKIIWFQRILIAFVSTILMIFGVLSFRQSLVWHDGVSLFSRVLSLSPDSWIAHQNRAGASLMAGDTQSATDDLIAATRIRPDIWFIQAMLGSVYEERKQYSFAEASYRKALAISPDSIIAEQLSSRIDAMKKIK